MIYQVQVVEWHKNPLENDIITVYGTHFPNDVVPEPDWGVVEFEIGDTVYLYINQTEDGLNFREYGSKLLESVYPEGIVRSEPEPEHNIVNETNLEKAMQNLRQSFHENVSFGPFNMKDVIVGYGTDSGSITVDVKTEYYESEYLEIIKENIQEIAGNIHVKYVSADEITDEQICGVGTELVDGVCLVIETERQGYGPVPTFVDALFFMQITLPFFVPGSIIFVVLSKTPRYSKITRLSVCIPAIIVILYFLSGLFLGWYPLGYA